MKDAKGQRFSAARKHHLLPAIWPGYLLAVSAFLVGFAEGIYDPDSTANQKTPYVLLISAINLSYWIFCIFRIHRVLVEATDGNYPIRPWKAAGFMFIPFFNIYWLFRWNNQIASFVNSQQQKVRVRRYLAPAVQLLGLIAARLVDGSLGLLILYGSLHTVKNKLSKCLSPDFDSLRLTPDQFTQGPGPRRVAFSAAIGCAFGFILWQAAEDFWNEPRADQLHELIAIVLVALGIVVFIDPLSDLLRKAFGDGGEHTETANTARAAPKLLLAILLIVLPSVSHALLHLQADKDPSGMIAKIMVSLILAGGITFAWTRGMLRRPSRSALLGAVWGGFCGVVGTFTVWAIALANSEQKMLLATLELYVLLGTLVWPLVGFAGGWALDKHWDPRPAVALPRRSLLLCWSSMY